MARPGGGSTIRRYCQCMGRIREQAKAEIGLAPEEILHRIANPLDIIP